MSTTTRVDFYVLDGAGENGRLHFACRLAEKAYESDIPVYAHTASRGLAQKLDDMLWTFRQGSFIPHELLTGDAPRAPVRIGTDEHSEDSGEFCINLTAVAPPFTIRFARIAEIVDAETRAEGRARFRQYRELGIEPQTHQIR